MAKAFKKLRHEPTQSDRTILIRVEDLISATFGSMKRNEIDFEYLRLVFNILARQMRIMDQEVEIRLDEEYSRRRGFGNIGKINVVTASEFDLLYNQVQRLQSVAVPRPPTLPEGMEKDKATLPDAMEATKLNARLKAAEGAVELLISLLTQLVVKGLIPAHLLANMGFDVGLIGVSSTGSIDSDFADGQRLVTEMDLMDHVEALEEEVIKKVKEMMYKTAAMEEATDAIVNDVLANTSIMENLASRITEFYSLTADNIEQVKRFAAEIEVKLNAFEEEMALLDVDLKAGMEMLKGAGSVQTKALEGLKYQYWDIVADLGDIRTDQKALYEIKNHLDSDVQKQKQCVKTLQEQKAEVEEMRDGLKNKVDLASLAGMLSDNVFDKARSDLEKQISSIYKLFNQHDKKWFTAVRELMDLYGFKAENTRLTEVRDSASKQLNEMRDKLDKLYEMLGDPQIAIDARELSKGGWCGNCVMSTLMMPTDAISALPPRLPEARSKVPKEELRPVKQLDWGPCPKPDPRVHKCLRYAGGSHTVLHGALKKPKPPEMPPMPTKKIRARGADGMLYMLEELCTPCMDCNDPAAGDSAIFRQPNNDGPLCNAAGDNAVGATGENNAEQKKSDLEIHVIYPELPEVTK